MRLILKKFLFLLSLLQTSQNLPALPAIPDPQQRPDLSAYFEELKALHERLKLELNSQNPFNDSIGLKNLRRTSSLLQSLDLIYTDPQGQRYLRVPQFNDLSKYITHKLVPFYHPDTLSIQNITAEEKEKSGNITKILNNIKDFIIDNTRNLAHSIFTNEIKALTAPQQANPTASSEIDQEKALISAILYDFNISLHKEDQPNAPLHVSLFNQSFFQLQKRITEVINHYRSILISPSSFRHVPQQAHEALERIIHDLWTHAVRSFCIQKNRFNLFDVDILHLQSTTDSKETKLSKLNQQKENLFFLINLSPLDATSKEHLFDLVNNQYHSHFTFLTNFKVLTPEEKRKQEIEKAKDRKNQEMKKLTQFSIEFFEDLDVYENKIFNRKSTITFAEVRDTISSWRSSLMQRIREMRFEQAQKESSEFLTHANQQLLKFFAEQIFLKMDSEHLLNIKVKNVTNAELKQKSDVVLRFINMYYNTEKDLHESLIKHLNTIIEEITELILAREQSKDV